MLTLISGPCILENKDMALEICETMKETTDKLGINYIFKASYKKANRTSINSFTGTGFKECLDTFQEIRNKGILITTDVHERQDIDIIKHYVDILQIPAFLSRQTDLLVHAGKTGKTVNVKQGQFLAPWDMKNVIDKIQSTGNDQIMITHRGICHGYNSLIVDYAGLEYMQRNYKVPIVMDCTHATMKMGGHGDKSSADRTLAPVLAKAAVAIGIRYLFMETHMNPPKAKSDADAQIFLKNMPDILYQLKEIHETVKGFQNGIF